MNWEAIGALAELLAAVGVIVSLVYLASQIRHSREQMRQNTRAVEAQVTWAHWDSTYKIYHARAGPRFDRVAPEGSQLGSRAGRDASGARGVSDRE